LQRLVVELRAGYGDTAAYALLARVYAEHFVEVPTSAADPVFPTDSMPPAALVPPVDPVLPTAPGSPTPSVRPRQGAELSAASLQSPDDPAATFRHQRGQDYRGYVCNVTETCHPDNPVQLITKTQVAPNVTDDEALLVAALPDLVARTDLDDLHLDGGFNGPAADAAAQALGVTLQYTAIRGGQPGPLAHWLTQLTWVRDDQHQLVAGITPEGHRLDLRPGRQDDRYIIHVPRDLVAAAPAGWAALPWHWLKGAAGCALYLQARQIAVAENRQQVAQQRQADKQLRPAVEATVRSVKHPLAGGKAPVRGQMRMGLMLTASSAMTNIRRLWRYHQAQRACPAAPPSPTGSLVSAHRFNYLRRWWRTYLSWSLQAMFDTKQSLSVIPV